MQTQAPDTLTTVPVASFASAPVPLSGIPTDKLPHEDLMGLLGPLGKLQAQAMAGLASAPRLVCGPQFD